MITDLAVRWRESLDVLGVAWQFVEPHVMQSLGMRAPVLYLPQSQQLVVIREAVSPGDALELARLYNRLPPRVALTDGNPDVRVVVALPRGHLIARIGGCWMQPALFQCAACRGWWFLDDSQGWRCQCSGCGAYDGNCTVAHHFPGRITPWPQTAAPSDARTTRCPPRAWLGVRRG
jgi:hypothetical protein